MAQEHYIPDTWKTGSDAYSTTECRMAAGLTLPGRTPLGQNATTGEFHAWDPAASDGTEVATRMTIREIDTTAGAANLQMVKSGTYNPDLVNWPVGTTDAQKLCCFVGSAISLQTPG